MKSPVLVALALAGSSCSTAGSAWMSEAESPADETAVEPRPGTLARSSAPPPAPERFRTQVISSGPEPEDAPTAPSGDGAGSVSFGGGGSRTPLPRMAVGDGKVLGTFRNTYYDFPSETDFQGEQIPLRDARCGAISSVPRGFFEAICVQGSGILSSGKPVSFAKRDCECADVCPRTGERICFEALDAARFPWGRGARGQPITPLLTVAVDDTVVPLGSALYVPEYDGLPVSASGTPLHDGCFIAEDRGLRVKGQHLDVFTGSSEMTALWNRLVPSNRGVTVVLGSPKCARADVSEAASALSEKPKQKPAQPPKTRRASQ